MRRTLITAAAGATGALALAGFGASTVTTATASPSPAASLRVVSKSQFIASADAICKSDDRRTTKLLNGVGSTLSPAFWRAFGAGVTRAQTIDSVAFAQLRALPEPIRGRAAIAMWLHAVHREVVLLTPLIRATDAQSLSETITAEENLELAHGRQDGLAQAYGFKACGHA